MNDLNNDLRSQAVSLGLCNDWQGMWQNNWSEQKMVEQMYRGLDFCIKHHWPSNDYIMNHFDIAFRRKSNVFVNDRYSVCNPNDSLILGKSDITIRFNGESHGNIHIRDNSSVKLSAKNRSFVLVHLYENAYIDASQYDKAKIVLIKHSENVTIVAEKEIKIREDLKYLQ